MAREQSTSTVATKLERFAGGHPPAVLELFSGCGGLSLGFQRAGYRILGGLEREPQAAAIFAANLHREETSERRAVLAKPRDIQELAPAQLFADLGFEEGTQEVDVLVGGPPCQAYARVGRAKLRQVMNHPQAFSRDERGELFLRYIEYVQSLQPLIVLIENVPDVLNYAGRNIAREMGSLLQKMGYLVNIGLLNAACFGVPQIRRRVYLLAFHLQVGRPPSFPSPTHRVQSLPSGYREFAALAASLRGDGHPFSGPSPDSSDLLLPDAVTVRDAIADLPQVSSHLAGIRRHRHQQIEQLLPYSSAPQSSFAREMRVGWLGFEGGDAVRNHLIRFLPRDYPIFARMTPGDQYPQARAIALALFDIEVARLRSRGLDVSAGDPAWESLRRQIVPPYDPAKFPNKWCKMKPDSPARTLLAHLSHDSYTHIHYDDAQARTISVREAARLQSFPDGFRLPRAMNPAFRMLGNAVPPLMAYHLGRHLLRELRGAALDQTNDSAMSSPQISLGAPCVAISQ